jgi:glycosyltransferase involved in cell wall biosynthesis
VTVVSEFARSYVVERFGVDPAKLRVVYLGVDTRAIEPRAARAAVPPHGIACVASLVAPKGHGILLKACRRLRDGGLDVRCILVGEGELRPDLEREIGELGLSGSVEMPGQRPPSEVMRVLRGADAFVLPCVVEQSGNRDGIPVALMEAMASGLPVVSTTVSGIPELIENGVSGLLTEPGDVAGLADALRRVLTDAALAARLGEAARATIEQRFDRRKSAARLIELFREAVGGAAMERDPPSRGSRRARPRER